MGEDWLSRARILIGDAGIEILENSTVAVVGLGGVGGAAVEALCRSGVGRLILVDHDVIDLTNLNRQIIATTANIGQKKCSAWEKRVKDINPMCEVICLDTFYNEDTSDALFEHTIDYIIDGIDTVTSKLHLVAAARERNIPLIMCLGAGNRLSPSSFKVGDITDTIGSKCKFSRVMRRELKRRGIVQQRIVFSTEDPYTSAFSGDSPKGRHSPGSISFCPPVAGYIAAGEAINDLLDANSSKS
ncbi:MAG: tRNA threonylcarbamoyladenosine dehydratase [Clostridiales bacterium]|nr:tRNA threonylcarbamoyladenosine dehydratase [Clostridiales bacterium]